LKEANESFDTDAIIAAQEALLEAKLEMRDAEKFKVPLYKSIRMR